MKPNSVELEELKSFIRHLAFESGLVIKNYFGSPLAVEAKADSSPVTIADRHAEEIIRKLIVRNYPTHGIVGEEFGTEKGEAQCKWLVDALDGTKSFICGSYDFGTLIAFCYEDEPLIGAINHPIFNQLLIGDNIKTELNEHQVRVQTCDLLSDAIMCVTDIGDVLKFQRYAAFERLAREVKFYRTWGNCFGYSLLARGLINIMIDPVMDIWDCSALIPIINGAGGVITDYQGRSPINAGSIVASNPLIHDRIIDMLNVELAK